jgi:hypothetical protein
MPLTRTGLNANTYIAIPGSTDRPAGLRVNVTWSAYRMHEYDALTSAEAAGVGRASHCAGQRAGGARVLLSVLASIFRACDVVT